MSETDTNISIKHRQRLSATKIWDQLESGVEEGDLENILPPVIILLPPREGEGAEEDSDDEGGGQEYIQALQRRVLNPEVRFTLLFIERGEGVEHKNPSRIKEEGNGDKHIVGPKEQPVSHIYIALCKYKSI